ncbi:glycyl-radical enzyme activating protein [Clostridium botulinum]|nr:glycyl-radical enzyme activating protein [Clostridium botulinum]
MEKALICNIEKYATHDGPGIRTVVFFKGCPLKCIWCSNPETQSKKNELYYNKKKCIGCGSCIKSCDKNALSFEDDLIKIDRDKCNSCGKCTDICPTNALNLVAKEMTIDEVFKEVIKDEIFYSKSGGGVTLSGGEVLSNGDFALDLLKKCKENYINTAIETSGFGETETLLNLSKFCDLVMFDIKNANNEFHKKFIDVDNSLIIKNLETVSKVHDNIIIRIPLIPNFNDSEENIKKVIDLALKNRIREIHLLPYHSLGKEKYNQLNRKYDLNDMKTPNKDKTEYLKEVIEKSNIKCIIGG